MWIFMRLGKNQLEETLIHVHSKLGDLDGVTRRNIELPVDYPRVSNTASKNADSDFFFSGSKPRA